MPAREDGMSRVTSFWYREDENGAIRALGVLEALRRFRTADAAMRHRTQAEMEMNESDLLAIRYLISSEAQGTVVGPKDLSAVLGITSAATAKLLARLVESGHIRREPHPSDRRAQVLHATPSAHDDVRATLGGMHRRMLEAAEALTPAQQKAVIHFLDSLSVAVSVPEDLQRVRPVGSPPTLDR